MAPQYWLLVFLAFLGIFYIPHFLGYLGAFWLKATGVVFACFGFTTSVILGDTIENIMPGLQKFGTFLLAAGLVMILI